MDGTQNSPSPLSSNFNRYFLAEKRVFLDGISYESKVKPGMGKEHKMKVSDYLVALPYGNTGMKVSLNRLLNFENEGPFSLSVTYSVILVFNPGTKNEVDWRKADVANEFKRNCPEIYASMENRAALIVAEITREATGIPFIFTPLRIPQDRNPG